MPPPPFTVGGVFGAGGQVGHPGRTGVGVDDDLDATVVGERVPGAALEPDLDRLPVERVDRLTGRGAVVDLDDHRVDDARSCRRHQCGVEPVVVVVDVVGRQVEHGRDRGRVSDRVVGRLDPVLDAAGADEVDGADHLGDGTAVDVHAVGAGRQHTGDRLSGRAAHRVQRQPSVIKDGVELLQLDAGLDVDQVDGSGPQGVRQSLVTSVRTLARIGLDDVHRG